MAVYDNQPLVLEPGEKRRPWRALGPGLQRFLSVLRGGDNHEQSTESGKTTRWASVEAQTDEVPVLRRFPLARHGYDRVAVDAYVSELEQECSALDRALAEVRGRSDAAEEVASEIKRIGEQTSAVLMAANEQREEILRTAKADAERCVAEATASARTVTEHSEARLRELDAQTQAAQGQRDRLLAELRAISGALAAAADSVEGTAERTST